MSSRKTISRFAAIGGLSTAVLLAVPGAARGARRDVG